MSKTISLILFTSVLLLTSCVKEEAPEFTNYVAPAIEERDGVDAIEDRAIDFEIPKMEINVEDKAAKNMGERYSYKIVKQPAHGKLEDCLVGQSVKCRYIPNHNFFGEDEFKYIAYDGPIESNIATIKIYVENVDDPPTFSPDDIYKFLKEDERIGVSLEKANDPDRDTLTYKIVNQPKNGKLYNCFEFGHFCYYQAKPNFYGEDSFSYSATDGRTTIIKNVNLKITSVNDAPYFSEKAKAYGLAEDTFATFKVSKAVDIDSRSVTHIVTKYPKRGSVSSCSAKSLSEWGCKYVPNANFFGLDEFSIVAVDNEGSRSNEFTFKIQVTPVADKPVFVKKAISLSTDEDTPLIITLPNAIDSDNDIEKYVVSESVSHGVLKDCLQSNLDLVCYYKPSKNYNGADSFKYQVFDKSKLTDTATVNINVKSVNDGPVILRKNISAIVNEDSKVRIVMSEASDVDNKSSDLTYTITKNPIYGKLSNCSGNECDYKPNGNFSGSDGFTYKVSDPSGLTDSGTVILSVTEVDDAPYFADKVYIDLDEDNIARFNLLNAEDVDSNSLSYKLVDPPKRGVLSGCLEPSGLNGCVYTPTKNYYGEDKITYQVSDGVSIIENEVLFSISPINDNPYWLTEGNLDLKVTEDTPFLITFVSAQDIEGDSLSYHFEKSPAVGTLEEGCLENGKLSCIYTPNDDEDGTDQISYYVQDENGGVTTTKVINLDIVPVNDPPVIAENVQYTTRKNIMLNFQLPEIVDRDTSLASLQVTLVEPVQNGKLEGCLSQNKFSPKSNCRYTPSSNFEGVDGFKLKVFDGASTVYSNISIKVEDPYLSEREININVKEREKPLIKIAFIVDNSESMEVYQNTLAKNVGKMVEQLKGFNVELYLYQVNFYRTDYMISDKVDIVEPNISGFDTPVKVRRFKLKMEDSQRNSKSRYAFDKGEFRILPDASDKALKDIAKSVEKTIKTEMGRHLATHKRADLGYGDEAGLESLATLLIHDNSIFKGDAKYAGAVILSNEKSNHTRYTLYNGRYEKPRDAFTTYREVAAGTEGAEMYYYKITFKAKLMNFKYGDEVVGNCKDTWSQGDFCNDEIVNVPCNKNACSSIVGHHSLKREVKYINPETNKVTLHCKLSGCKEKLETGYKTYISSTTGLCSNSFNGASNIVDYHINSGDLRGYKDLEIVECKEVWKKEVKEEEQWYTPSNGSPFYKYYDFVNQFLDRNPGIPANNIASLENFNKLIIEAIDERVGVENFFLTNIIHDQGEDSKHQSCNGKMKDGASYGSEYKALAEKLGEIGDKDLVSTHSICANSYVESIESLKNFIEDKTDNTFLVNLTTGERVFSVEIKRGEETIHPVGNKDYTIEGNSIKFSRNYLEPDDDIKIIIRDYF